MDQRKQLSNQELPIACKACIDACLVGLHRGGIAQFQRVGNQRVADGDFEHTGHLAHKSGEVVAVQVVTGIDRQPLRQRGTRGCCLPTVSPATVA